MELDHIGIAVKSIEESRHFYEQGLGLKALPKIEEVAGEKVRVLKLECTERSHVELLEAMGDDSTIAHFITKRGPGVHHLCYRSQNLQADIKHLQELGFKPLWQEPRLGADGALVMFFHPKQTGGVLTELAQYEKRD